MPDLVTNTATTIPFHEFLSSSGGTLTRLHSGVEASFLKQGGWVTSRYSWEDLESIDARLAKVVSAMFTPEGQRVSYVSAYWMNNTIKFWKNPTPLFDVEGAPYVVDEVTQVLSFNRLTQVVTIAAVVCKVFKVDVIDYVRHTENADIVTTVAELEKTFPGWKMRYDVMTALGVEQRELMTSVFTREAIPPCQALSVRDVTFE